jgi:protein-L-isoaspartate(D-aspartate) O-methyltransferase
VLGVFAPALAGIIAEGFRAAAASGAHNRSVDDDVRARQQMVEDQIAGRGIRDPRILAAMTETPRHLFVPAGARGAAYEDRPLPIGEGQTISQPYMVALMTATLAPRESDRVLEIGTGSGYQTAILAKLSSEVLSIERHAVLADQARGRLAAAGIHNARVIVGDGGRLVIPVGPPALQRLVTVDRQGERFVTREGEACVFVPLIGRHGWEGH